MEVLDPKITTALRREFITAIKDEGLVLVPKHIGEHALTFYKKQQDLLKKKAVTPYQIANYNLLPGVTNLKTIKNMIADGRITTDESFKQDNKVFVLTEALKRLRNE